jgi:cytochrome c551/c552
MSNEIAELSELMECYRRRSKSVHLLPIAAAYADAADQLEEMIAGLKPAPPPAHRTASIASAQSASA